VGEASGFGDVGDGFFGRYEGTGLGCTGTDGRAWPP